MRDVNTAVSTMLLAFLMSSVVAANLASAQTAAPTKSTSVSKTAPALAGEPVDIKLERKKVTVVEGKEVLSSAAQAKPGDVLEDTATYTNLSKKNTRRVEATLPVPPFTEPVLGAIVPSNAKASLDGTTFAAIPLKRKVRQANGVMLEVAVPLAEYRFLRWSAISLAPEKKFVASARFRMLDNSFPTPPSGALPAATAASASGANSTAQK